MPSGRGAARGAMTGASIGSFIPGIGTGIGAGIGALGGWLFGGGGDDKKDENPEDPYLSLLKQSATRNQQRAGGLENLALTDLSPVVNYFKQLTSSNPAAVMDATRQERGRVIDQYDTARKAVASFAPRGGGAVSANAQSQFDQAQSLADITSGARRDAFQGAAALGTGLMGLSLSAEQLASTDLNTLINSIMAREGIETANRGQNMALAGSIGETIGTIVGLGMGGGDGGGDI